MLPHPCVLGGPQTIGDKSEVAASTLPSHGPKRGRKCLLTPALSAVPKPIGTKLEVAASPLANRDQSRAEMLPHPCILGDRQTKRDKIRIG